MRLLRPSLSTIEARLCGPSDALLERYCTDPLSLEEELRRQIERDEDAQDRVRHRIPEQNLLRAEEVDAADIADPTLAQIHELHTLLDRREAARSRQQSQQPIVGQVRLVERIVGPGGDAEYDLPAPLAVILNEPTTEESKVWYAWLASPDRDYASSWDLVLEDDVVDPLAGVVQCWNAVLVYLPSTTVVIGQLSEASLAAARSLAKDYAFGPDMDARLALPGQCVYRVVDGLRVLTGTPLGRDDADPRFDYQRFYHEAAEPLRDMAHEALGLAEEPLEADQAPLATDLVAVVKVIGHWVREQAEAQVERARQLGVASSFGYQYEDLVPTAASLSDDEPRERHVFDDLALQFYPVTGEGGGEIVLQLSWRGEGGTRIQVARNEQLVLDAFLDAERAAEEVAFRPGDKVELRVTGPRSYTIGLWPPEG